MTLVDELRTRLGGPRWERAVALARADAARRVSAGADEERWVVRPTPGGSAFEVTIWPAEPGWWCSCEQEACLHAGAAVAARAEGRVGRAEVARVTYRLLRAPEGLRVDRDDPGGAARLAADAELARVLIGWWGKPNLPRGLLAQALAALAECAVTLDGAAARADGRPVRPLALVTDQPPGWRVRLVRPPGIDEAFKNGAVRLGDVVRPYVEPDLDPVLRNRLLQGVDFAPDEAEKLVSDFLPRLRKLLDVEVRTARLPEVVDVAPRLVVEVGRDGDRVRVTPRIVYGDPAFARVERGRLVRFGHRIPRRDEVAEGRLEAELARDGMVAGGTVERPAMEAARWAEQLRPALRDAVLGRAPELRVDRAGWAPRVSITEAGDHFRVEIAAGGVDPAALLRAWRDHAPLVPLLGGGYRVVPREWLDRFGPALAELVEARGRDGAVERASAALLLDAAEALEVPVPPGLAALRALAGDFSAIPTVGTPAGFRGELRPYQQRGVDWIVWLASVGMGGVLADDMGLGKTVQGLAAAAHLGGPTLVVAPTSVVRNWEAEARRFVPGLSVNVYHGPRRVLVDADLTLTTWAVLRLDAEVLAGRRWRLVLLDEAQAMKNPDSQVAQAARRVGAELKVAVTGTPVENRLEELWSLFHCVLPGLLGGRAAFRDRFAGPIEAGQRGARDQLRRRIRPFVLRRLKQEVAKDLPPRTDMVLRCTLSEAERARYDAVRALGRAEVAKLLGAGRTLEVLELLLRLRQAACHPGLLPGGWQGDSAKTELLLDTLDEVVAEGHRALVFSQWTSFLDLLEPALRARGLGWERLDGSTVDRAGVVARFNAEDGPPVFLLSLTAGGTGLNLTAADYVFHLDPWWNPAVEDQATGRAHRIGQTRPVVSCRLIAEDTVEERILALQEKKRGLAAAALDDEALAKAVSREELLALFD